MGEETASTILQTVPDGAAARVVKREPDGLVPGDRLGRYVLGERLGAGGMGVVYSAHDPELDRRVAIKLLREESSGAAEVQRTRLQREAQAMARLSHGNVITVYDVDSHQDRVFISMELIEGGTLRDWLRVDRTWRATLEVFLQAGRGLEAAHSAGVIHRDFKPDNVLVSDGGRVVVTDFGLARADDAVASSDGDEPPLERIVTRTGARLGTPAYMSPEQHRGDPADARSDQFAFCVALYEALYAERPFAAESGADLATDDAFALAVVSGKVKDAPAGRGIPARVRRAVLKGLAVAPGDRHASLDALLAELTRVLLLRRNAVGVLAGVAAVAIGAGGYAALSSDDRGPRCDGFEARPVAAGWTFDAKHRMQMAFVATQRPHALESWSRVARALDERAAAWTSVGIETCRATHVRGTQSAALLDVRMHCLDRRLSETAALIDALTHADADVVDGAVQAVAKLESIAECSEASPGSAPRMRTPAASTLEAMLDRAKALHTAGRSRDALALAKNVYAQARALGNTPLASESLFVVADTQEDVDDELVIAETTYGEVLRLAADTRDDVITAKALVALIRTVALAKGRPDAALALVSAAEAAVARAGNGLLLRADLARNKGIALKEQGKLAEARTAYEQALALRERALGSRHIDVALDLNSVALGLGELGDWAAARTHEERALAIIEETLGRDHPMVASVRATLGYQLWMLGDHDAARRQLEHVLADQERLLGPDHSDVAFTLLDLGGIANEQGRAIETEALYRRAVAIRERVLGTDHPHYALALGNLGLALTELGRYDEAERALQRALEIRERLLGRDHPRVAHTVSYFGALELQRGRPAQARRHYHRAFAIREKALGPDHEDTGRALQQLAEVELAAQDCGAARDYIERSLTVLRKSLGADHPDLLMPLRFRGEALLCQGAVKDAVLILEDAIALAVRKNVYPAMLAEVRFALARALWTLGRDRDRALTLARDAQAMFAGMETRRKDSEAIVRWLAHRGAR